jgi:hypothetical protein
MPFTGKRGDSFYLPDGGGHHRYVILTNPDSNGKVVVINFTDAQNPTDCPVIFNPKDDPKLFTKRTTINCAYAQVISVAKLKASKIDRWEMCQLNNVKQAVIGAFRSQHTPTFIIDALKVQYPNEYNQYFTP